jgi:hypothetical protein
MLMSSLQQNQWQGQNKTCLELRGGWRGGEQGGKMTQTMYAHVNKWTKYRYSSSFKKVLLCIRSRVYHLGVEHIIKYSLIQITKAKILYMYSSFLTMAKFQVTLGDLIHLKNVRKKEWGCSSVVQFLSSMCKAWGLISHTTKQTRQTNKKTKVEWKPGSIKCKQYSSCRTFHLLRLWAW